MVVTQGDIWWTDLGEATDSAPAFRRPVLVVQGNAMNRSALQTAVCVALTGNLKWATAPGNVRLAARTTGLPKDSVANVSHLVTVDKSALTDRVGSLSASQLRLVLAGIDVVLGRER